MVNICTCALSTHALGKRCTCVENTVSSIRFRNQMQSNDRLQITAQVLAELRATEIRMKTQAWASHLRATFKQGCLATTCARAPVLLWRPAPSAASRAEKVEKNLMVVNSSSTTAPPPDNSSSGGDAASSESAPSSSSSSSLAAASSTFAARLAAQHDDVEAKVIGTGISGGNCCSYWPCLYVCFSVLSCSTSRRP